MGYGLLYTLGDSPLPAAFDPTLQALAGCWALIADLRFNGGGGERLARELAARFVDTPRVGSLSQCRNGPQRSDRGSPPARMLEPRGPSCFEAPVVCLQPQ